MPLDITAIILTYNEEIHIRRCLENLNSFSCKVYVVDSFSTDATVDIARELGAEVVQYTWPGNQAEQFNRALDNLQIDTDWIVRLDADEYLTQPLIDELRQKLPAMPKSVSALSLSRARAYCGKVLRHGIVGDVRIIRIFRKGMARYEKRIMDEHLSVLSGDTVEMKHAFVDDNRMPIGRFVQKHNEYASREAALLLDAEYHLTETSGLPQNHGEEVSRKRAQKARYAKMPLFWRAVGYFFYRYIIRLGFLDGREGFLWDFMQGLWYRTLVDAKIFEIKKACGDDKEKIKQYLKEEYNISL